MQARVLARLIALLVVLATPLLAVAQPGVTYEESLEWMVADSAVIVRGHVVAIERSPGKSIVSEWLSVTFRPEETLRGPRQQELKFVVATTSYPDYSPFARWQKEGTQLLVFLCESRRLGDRHLSQCKYAPRSDWSRSFIDLGQPVHQDLDVESLTRPANVQTMRGEHLTDPQDILAHTKAAIAATPEGTAISTQLGQRGGLWHFAVPVDGRLEQLAREWLTSSSASNRLNGLQAIEPFDSPENVNLVRGVLREPAPDPAPQKTPNYTFAEIKREARDLLDEWGVGWENRALPTAAPEMVFIPPGAFKMGSNEIQDAKPEHQVYLPGYWIGKTDVTVSQFRAYIQATGTKFPWDARRPDLGWKDNHPMVDVTWDEARAYCIWAGGDLPTEPQWEKAARGSDGRKFPWGNEWNPLILQCWQRISGEYHTTSPVGSYPSGASPYGCMDMAGNVAQWCLDLVTRNPSGQGSGHFRALRGEGWNGNDSNRFRCAERSYLLPEGMQDNIGFRIVAKQRLRLASIPSQPTARPTRSPPWPAREPASSPMLRSMDSGC